MSAGSYHSTALGGEVHNYDKEMTLQCVVLQTSLSDNTEDGSLLSWGLNQHGQCGVGPLTNELKSLGKHKKKKTIFITPYLIRGGCFQDV